MFGTRIDHRQRRQRQAEQLRREQEFLCKDEEAEAARLANNQINNNDNYNEDYQQPPASPFINDLSSDSSLDRKVFSIPNPLLLEN